ncbi:MAG TPA: glycosyltransferase family 39 protein [Candidatus Bathyarchaeia archaeon]|nr:glycosyltransferase family 39 protein [Candidatus Bathyarchaeia archaeon]
MKAKYWVTILVLVGFIYRIVGLGSNFSFWTDEVHVAIFARAILERGRPVLANGYSTGVYQWLQYWLSATSAKIFGLSELGIRFPTVVFGTLTIVAIYLLGKELFDCQTALVAAAFTTFLRIEILWSRQARPYQALQFFYLLGAWFIFRLSQEERFNWKYFLGFLFSGALASLMHGLGLVVFGVGLTFLLVFRPRWLERKWVGFGLSLFSFFLLIFKSQIFSVASFLGKTDNLFYYRVFLWHNYRLLFFLAVMGFLFLVFRKKLNWQLPFSFLIVQGIIISFFLNQPFTRYLYPIFPFFILFSAFGLTVGIRLVCERIKRFLKYSWLESLAIFCLTLLIIVFGTKFAPFPQKSYSLNEDMQEIPEVDWNKVYGYMKEKLSQDESLKLVANWNDLTVWYLGEGKLNYLVRKPSENPQVEDSLSGAKIIYSLTELEETVTEGKGLLIIDSWDNQVPEGVRGYVQTNLKREIILDRLYPFQPRYWSVEVFSWGQN